MKYLLLCLCCLVNAADAVDIQVISESVQEESLDAAGFVEAVFGAGADSREVYMYLTADRGDTLWSCPLEGTHFSLHNPPEFIKTANGSFLVNCSPDCFAGSTPLQRISTSGETLWFTDLTTESLVDSCEFVELSPRINTMVEISNGNMIVAGTVSPFLGAAAEWFVVCLSGTTGKVLWKNHGYLTGFAGIGDVVEISSGALLAVGGTAESIHPGGAAPDMIRVAGEYEPLILLLESTGECSETWIIDLELTDRFTGVTSMGYNRFLIAGYGIQLMETTETVVKLTF